MWKDLQQQILDSKIQHKKGFKYPKLLEIFPDFGKKYQTNEGSDKFREGYITNSHAKILDKKFSATIKNAIKSLKTQNISRLRSADDEQKVEEEQITKQVDEKKKQRTKYRKLIINE